MGNAFTLDDVYQLTKHLFAERANVSWVNGIHTTGDVGNSSSARIEHAPHPLQDCGVLTLGPVL